ncbi:MAG: tRNA pseudouridine(55) synthase TruB [Patescibacteria group bacterium]
MKTETNSKLILIDKPTGLSSFDVIRVLRKKIGARDLETGLRIKIGHAGTLDPLASGLLLVAVGADTKKLKELIGLSKTYEMEILLGRKTETGDMEGKVIEEAEVVNIEADRARKVLEGIEGEIELEAPVYSALKVKGVPMYKLARSGEKVEPKKRKMKIHSLKLLTRRHEGKFFILKVVLECGSGTYARSVAEEVGRRLGLPATVYSLRRTRVGNYKVEDAETLESRK